MWTRLKAIRSLQKEEDSQNPSCEVVVSELNEISKKVLEGKGDFSVLECEILVDIYRKNTKQVTNEAHSLFIQAILGVLRNLAGSSGFNRKVLLDNFPNEDLCQRVFDSSKCAGERDNLSLKRLFQYIGNVVADQLDDHELWRTLMDHRSSLMKFLIDEDVQLSRYVSFALFGFVNKKSIERFAKLSDTKEILEVLLESTMKFENEFSLYIAETIVASGLVTDAFDGLTTKSKIFILDAIRIKIEKTNPTEFLSKAFSDFCIQRVKKTISALRTTDFNLTADESLLTVKMLRLLGDLGSYKFFCIQDDLELLVMSVEFLKSIHSMKCHPEFAPKTDYTSLTEPKEDITESPSYMLKSSLVRLISNVSYKHKLNQDTVRDLGGIFLLCDMSSLDARNPLITEEVVLALRNLLEDNLENQNVVSSLKTSKQSDS